MSRLLPVALLLSGCGTLGGEGPEAAERGTVALPSRGAAGFSDEATLALERAAGAPAGAAVVPSPTTAGT